MGENAENENQETIPSTSPVPEGDANQDELLNQDEIERLLAASLGGAAAPKQGEEAKPQEAPSHPVAAPSTATQMPDPQPAAPTAAETIASGDLEYLFNQAERALRSIDSPGDEGLPPGVEPFQLEPYGGAPASSEMATIDVIRDVELNVRIELGRTQLQIEDVLKLHRGSVVPLDKLAGDPVDIYVNDRLIARGEILVLNDNFCVRVTELVAERAIA